MERFARFAMFTYHISQPRVPTTIAGRGGVFMNIEETLKIMRSLANGVDPSTDNKIEASLVCHQPNAVKALNRAISALVQEEKREQRKPTNAFRHLADGTPN